MGPDRIYAGRGDDFLSLTNDVYRDVIDCGPGRDVLLLSNGVDPLDSIVDCEEVIVDSD